MKVVWWEQEYQVWLEESRLRSRKILREETREEVWGEGGAGEERTWRGEEVCWQRKLEDYMDSYISFLKRCRYATFSLHCLHFEQSLV